jgi:site-specific DNA-methyltransferase (adenine-specific)
MTDIYCGDCRDIMELVLAENSVDAIVTDPPYGDTSLDWDKRVRGWLPLAAQVLKPNGSMWVSPVQVRPGRGVAQAERHRLPR